MVQSSMRALGAGVSTCLPVPVTATISSMRIPNCPARYTPGSMVTTMPASGLVHFPAACAWAHCGHRGLLGLQHRFVCVPLVGPGFSQVDGTGHIRAVTLENNTEVEGHEAPAGQLGGGGASVRQSRARARGDDGLKRHDLGPQQPGLVL